MFHFCVLVNRCQLEDISFEENETEFPALTSLQISDNKLKDWQSIFCLNFLPMLKDLKYKDNPITDSESAQTSRQIVIASIATLKVNTIYIQCLAKKKTRDFAHFP